MIFGWQYSVVASLLYAVICFGVTVFQICLICGAPWGRITQGGTHPKSLPISSRVFAGVSIILLTVMAGSIISAAGLWPYWPRWLGWCALGIQAISTLLNWITPSRSERLLWAPVTTVMLTLATVVLLA